MLEPVPETKGQDLSERERFVQALQDIAEHQSRQAFALLFEFFAPRIKSYMLRLGADEMLAEELAQEVMITVWQKAGQFDRTQASPSTWIFRIARNRRIDAYRRQKTLDAGTDEPALLPAELPHPEDSFDVVQIEERVRAAIVDLPDEQLVLLKAAFFDGLSHSEIAKKVDLPLGTVKSRIRLAFQKLRSKLEPEF